MVLTKHLDDVRARYREQHPRSEAAHRQRLAVMPGGNTRSALHFEPFPFTAASAEGCKIADIDGNSYVDFTGEFSAGLYGHSNPIIFDAVAEAMKSGIVLGAINEYEGRLAQEICARFPAIDMVRFCNSGTEANLLAISVAFHMTGRRKLLAFRHAYHGGLLNFPAKGNALNVPFDVVLSDYNDIEETGRLIRAHENDIGAIIVEPILGAGGNICGTPEFLRSLRDEADRIGALLIFDEVKTSRIGGSGLHGIHGLSPDLVTLGKYLGGGLPLAAFGGREDVMRVFDPRGDGALKHAGTFNNNVCSMAAGLAGLTKIFTPERAEAFHEESERYRQKIDALFRRKAVPMQVTGMGSILSIHFAEKAIAQRRDIPASTEGLRELLHLEGLLDGIYLIPRGDVFFSLAMEEQDIEKLLSFLDRFASRYGNIIGQELGRAAA